MKVSSISNIKINAFRGIDKNNNIPKDSQNGSEETPVVIYSPELFKQLYAIKPYSVLRNEKGEEYIRAKNLVIPANIVDILLRDKNGKISNNSTANFVRIYNDLLKEKTEQSIKNIKGYEDKKKSLEIFAHFSLEDLGENKEDIINYLMQETEDPFSEDLLSRLEKNYSYELINALETAEKTNFGKIPFFAFDDTIRIFDMSKKDEGYDFSDIQSKKKFIQRFEDISYNFDNTLDEVPYSIRFIKALRDKNGAVDYKLGLDAAYLTQNMSVSVEPKKYIDALKKWYAKSPNHRFDILNTAKNIERTFFGWSNTKNYMETIMDLCFTEDGDFDLNKRDVILDQVYAKNDEIERFLTGYKSGNAVKYVDNKHKELLDMFE